MDCGQQISQILRGTGASWVLWIPTGYLIFEIFWWVVLRRRELSENTRSLFRVIRHGAAWALVLAFASVPFGTAAPFVWIAGLIFLGATYLVARHARRSVPLLNYTPKEFIGLVVLTGALAWPFWFSAFSTLIAVMAAADCVKTMGY
jgi:hypothetical protein